MEQMKKNNLEENEKIENTTSIRKLKEKKQKKIIWRGSKQDLIYFFDQLFSQQLLSIKSYDEIFSIASHYFVDTEGKQIFVEKSASAKMNLSGPKIPAGYERYIKSIERLKNINS
ncbi:MAG: hypothetical protein CR986_10275 [Ignavibacteriae bacterium]|nr:MAG: hypothetical protein CR986_10275 [Ignavibacteriota bacterium]